jgi:2-O-(6-phospho-alpha-D-mannosyl)-D-glycerate hydrolase
LLGLGTEGATMRLRVMVAPVRRVLFDTGDVPGFAWSTFTAANGASPDHGVTADSGTLSNEHLRVEVEPTNGTFSVETADGLRCAGLGRLVDGGDGGDTYNYSPPDDDRVVDRPDSVQVSTVERGPVRARLHIDSTYSWPRAAIGDERSCSARTDETVVTTVRTTLELRAGEQFLRVTHDIDNSARDHRLRAHFPLPARVRGSDAECAFAVVHRGLTAEGGTHEFGLPTFPSRRFVDASDGEQGLALVHDGLLEYEIIGDGRELALTLLRAVGYVSRTEPSLRPNPAGPADPVEGAQLPGLRRVSYAVMPHRGDWRAADCYGAADAFLVPLERARVPATTTRRLPKTGQRLAVEGAEVSALLRNTSALVLRLFRTAPDDGTVTVDLDGTPARGWIVDLRGAPIAPFEGAVTMRPWEIVTLQIDSRSHT